jgi:hypothetical protein
VNKDPDLDEAESDGDSAEFEAQSASVPLPPHVSRLKAQGRGPYYVAPDSAEALPESIWQRIDAGDLAEAASRANLQLTEDLSADDMKRPNPPIPMGNYMSREARQLLNEIGGPTAAKVLNGLDPLEPAPEPKPADAPSPPLFDTSA